MGVYMFVLALALRSNARSEHAIKITTNETIKQEGSRPKVVLRRLLKSLEWKSHGQKEGGSSGSGTGKNRSTII